MQDTCTHISVQRAADVPAGVSVRQVTIRGGTELQRSRCAELVRAKVWEYQMDRADEQVCHLDGITRLHIARTRLGSLFTPCVPLSVA